MRLISEEYGCKVIWATFLASYFQLPVGHLCSFRIPMSPKSVFATRVTKSVHLQACMGLEYWQLLCLAVERSWLVLATVDDFSPCIFALMGLENVPLTLLILN